MISVTLEEHMGAAKRLVSKIREKSKITPVLAGGLAIKELTDEGKQKMAQSYKVSLIPEASLKKNTERGESLNQHKIDRGSNWYWADYTLPPFKYPFGS